MPAPAPPYSPPPDHGLAIVHADEALLVLDKPAGLLTVPGRGPEKADCLISRVQQRFADALIVHRLDMETSGLVVLARGAAMQRQLSIAFAERKVHKRYIALLAAQPPQAAGSVDLPLLTDWPNRPRQKVDFELGKPALTHYEVLGADAQGVRVALEPVTGRSHQLRVHMLSLGLPIVGDTLYGGAAASRLMLHAESLRLIHPESGKECEFFASAPF